MCDLITLAIVGATGGALLSAADSTLDLFGRYEQQEEMNKAIEDAYNQELEMARSQAIIEQQNLNIETQAEQLANRQEERQMEQEAMVSNAAAEAAASSLNIAGNTAQRAAAVTDVNTLNRQGAFEARGENIQTQHLMNALGIKQNYDTQTKSARLNAEASWRPLTGNFFEEAFSFGGNVLSGALSGAQLGMTYGKLKGSAATSATETSSRNPTGLTDNLLKWTSYGN